jgi:hypothetical protein
MTVTVSQGTPQPIPAYVVEGLPSSRGNRRKMAVPPRVGDRFLQLHSQLAENGH